jgi:anaerobic magnesium-protoporphyrin IX monomethyl ester cyclase
MNRHGKLLLINPRIVARHKARFPLSLLSLAGALEDEYESDIVDGNIEDGVAATLRSMEGNEYNAVGVTVMGGPQVRTAIEISSAVRKCRPDLPIIWGGYFPTLYRTAALNAPYVDFLLRGQGEDSLRALLRELRAPVVERRLDAIDGLSWKQEERAVHNPERKFAPESRSALLPYHLLGDPRKYFVRTFLGRRTVAHQAALGCRFRCTFCGVAAMFRGATSLPAADRLEHDLLYLRDHIGADSVQFCDHNFFDREEDMLPLLEVLAKVQIPWWCYARADALLNLSESAWELVQKSKLRMAYIGAESPSEALLKDIRKGTHASQTLAVAELCKRRGVIPEMSFMVAPPQDPEGETERTFEFVRQIKRINSESEIIIYIYTPIPTESLPSNQRTRAAVWEPRDCDGRVVHFPKTPEEWTEKRWVDYSCHADAPWMNERLRQRIRDFHTVLGCRFPTIQDVRYSHWTKKTLSAVAAWRYRFKVYDRPWELRLSRNLIKLADPRVTSI